MSDVLSPKVLIEVFNEPKVFSDHFLERDPTSLLPLWVQTPAGQVTFNGDSALLTIKAGETNVHFSKAVSYSSAVYGHILLRVLGVSNHWQLWVQRADLMIWVKVAEEETAGLFDVNAGAVYSGSVVGLDLVAYGAGGDTAEFCYVVVCKSLIVSDEGKLTGKTSVSLPTLKDGVQGANFTLQNGDGAYDAIKEQDAIVIFAGRSGEVGVKLFGGRVRKTQREGLGVGRAKLTVWCHGHAYELNNPPSNLRESYSVVNGRTIIEDGLNLCRYLVKHPTAAQWFDNAGASGSTDDRITSTHSVEYDQEKPYNPMVEVADKASNGSNVGFDLVDTPAGCLIGHLRGSLDFTCAVVPVLRHYVRILDACQVRNRQTVYGAKKRCEPSVWDDWTLDSVGNWIAVAGTLSEGTANPYFQSNYLKCVPSTPNPGQAYFSRDLSTLVYPVTGKGKDAYGKINFATWVYGYILTSVQVRLRAPDLSNCFTWTPNVADYSWLTVGNWKPHVVDLGEANEFNAIENADGVWVKTGSPDWLHITRIDFLFVGVAGSLGFVGLDGFSFSDGAFRATGNHLASQAELWGIVEAEPESDGALLSDAECLARANSILANLAYPTEILDPVTVEGNAVFRPGDRVYLLGAYRVLREVVHVFEKNMWDSELRV